MYVVLREFQHLDGVSIMALLILLMVHVAVKIGNMQEVLQLQIISIMLAMQ